MQFRIAQAIRDDDKIKGNHDGCYLARAASLMRTMFGKSLRPDKGCELERAVSLVLTQDGPVYMSAEQLATISVRRVVDFYYTHDFAVRLFRDALLSKGSFNKVRVAAVSRAVEAGSQIWTLLPSKVAQWENLVADVFGTYPSFQNESGTNV